MTYKPVDDCEFCWTSKDGCLGILQHRHGRRCCVHCTHPELKLPEFGILPETKKLWEQAQPIEAPPPLTRAMLQEMAATPTIKIDDRHFDVLLTMPIRTYLITGILPPKDGPEPEPPKPKGGFEFL